MRDLRRPCLVALLAAGMPALRATAAEAAPIVQTVSLLAVAARTGSFGAPVATGGGSSGQSFAGFDSSLGTLDSVFLQLRGTQQLETELSYFDSLGASVPDGVLESRGSAALAFFPLPGVRVPVVASLTGTVSCVAPCSGRTLTTSAPLAVDLSVFPGTDLHAYFSTHAVVTMAVDALVEARVINGAASAFRPTSFALYSLADLRLVLTYNYTPTGPPPPPPPVPEPTAASLLAIGLGLMRGLGRWPAAFSRRASGSR